MNGWHEVRFEVGRADVDPWSDALLEAGALSVQAEDADAESPDEQPLYGEPGLEPTESAAVSGWQRTVLAALIARDEDPEALVATAAGALDLPLPQPRTVRFIADQDWVRATQSQFEPILIGERLRITPSWHSAAAPDRIDVVLDPGLAFGTGSHPTTRLCLQWLEQHLSPTDTVIDYGCGSGILAIAAARLGASSVCGIDIDPQALIATAENARRNAVQVDVRSSEAPRPLSADVVVANILSIPLKVLAPLLIDLVKPGGALVLSGILARQIDEVAAVYAPALPLTVAGLEDGWACLAGIKAR